MNKPDISESFSNDLLVKDNFPDYLMEFEAPSMYETRQKHIHEANNKELDGLNNNDDNKQPIITNNHTNNSEKITDVKEIYVAHGVILDFISYVSQGFNPVLIMKSGIKEWERRFQQNT